MFQLFIIKYFLLFVTELDFMMTKSSLLASASILAAAIGLKVSNWQTALTSVCPLSGCLEDDVSRIALVIEELILTHFKTNQHDQISPVNPSSDSLVPIAAISTPPSAVVTEPPKALTPPPPPSTNTQPATPTDIQEILF